MKDSQNNSYMYLRVPIGSVDCRTELFNYYQGQPLYFSREVFSGTDFWMHDLWWEVAKKVIRNEPKAQIII